MTKFVIIFTALMVINTYAQSNNKSLGVQILESVEDGLKQVNDEVDKEYKKASKKKRPWLIRPSISRSVSNLVLRSKDALTDPVRFQPNTPVTIGMSIGYGDYTLGYGVARELSDRQIKQRGKTTFSNLQFQYVSSGIGVEIFYHDFKGFYIADKLSTGFVIQTIFNYSDNESTVYPEMRQIAYGGNLFYFFDSKKFQYNALFGQTKQPKGDGGSWIAMISGNHFRVNNNGTLIPNSRSNDYGDNATISGFEVNTLSALGGYGYQFVWKKDFYLGGMILTGLGVSKQELYDVEDDLNITGAWRGFLKLGGGYNSGTHFLTTNFQYDHTAVLSEDLSVGPATYSMELNFGYRFK